ncbi:MAG: DUF3786 domain-containing protein [Nitrospirae bacterium]|nr:DUF3786 domain-containing protein [Nitrospirota bacterium]
MKAWDSLLRSGLPENASVRFLADKYVVDVKDKQVLSLSRNAPAEDYLTVLILHYLTRKIAGLPVLTGERLGFSGLSAAGSFAEEFKRRSTDLIVRTYGNNPDNILSVLDRMPGEKINRSDVAIVLEAFEGAPVFIELWRADEEFGPEANLLFDKSITQIFCTEDIVVLAEAVAIAISQEVY